MTALVVLTRVLPAEALDDVSGLLTDAEAQKLAMLAADLERFQASPLLATVPPDAVTCHAVSEIEIDAKKAFAELELSRKARTAPLRDEVTRVNALYGFVTGPLEEISKKASKLVVAHNQAERARVQREERERQRLAEEAARAESEAVARAEAATNETERKRAMADAEIASRQIATVEATAPAPVPRAYKSAAGTNSIVKRTVLVGFDPEKVPQKYYRHPEVQEALRKVLAAAVRAGYHDIVGVTIGEEEGTRSR